MFSFLFETLDGLLLEVLAFFRGRTATGLAIAIFGVLVVHVFSLPIGVAIGIDVAWVLLFTSFWHFVVGWRRTM